MTARKVSLILNIIGVALMVVATVFFIVVFVKTKNSLKGLEDEDEIKAVLHTAGLSMLLGIALPMVLAVFANIVGMMGYIFDGLKKADKLFFVKLALVFAPLVLLALYLGIILSLH